MKLMNAKFWAINAVAFLIILAYTSVWIWMSLKGLDTKPFWQASPMALVFIGAFFYLLTEGKLVQKIILAKRLKEEGTAEEFKIIHRSSSASDKVLLDKIIK